jgi:chloramphenicol-sensitive protein RarD
MGRPMNAGLLYAALAFAIWGVFPLYIHQLASVSPIEIVLHRSAWSLVFVLGVLAALRRWAWIGEVWREPRRILIFGASALLLAINWLVYVYAVNSHRVVDASLGYFINPLVNVMLGVLVLHERLRRPQWAAVAMAAAGVLWLTLLTGTLPWIALVLAFSFGTYGLLRKTASLGALEGLALETFLLAPLVLPWLVWWTWQHGGALTRGDPVLTFWLVAAGPLTALPLLLFAAGARRLPLATVGLMQYLGPSIQLALGIWVFHEPFDARRLIGFALIWSALAVYSLDGWRMSRRTAAVGTASAT